MASIANASLSADPAQSSPDAQTISQAGQVVRMPKARTRQVRTRISYMTSDQLECFLKAAKEHGPREHSMFLFAVAHGARAQEICNLRMSDISFHNDQIHIARLKGSLATTQTLLKVKGNSLFDEKAAFKAWLGIRQPDAADYVFNTQKSIRMSRITVYKLFKEIAQAAGLGETLQHPHVLKHTAAMLMVQQGANAFLVRQQLGHRSLTPPWHTSTRPIPRPPPRLPERSTPHSEATKCRYCWAKMAR